MWVSWCRDVSGKAPGRAAVGKKGLDGLEGWDGRKVRADDASWQWVVESDMLIEMGTVRTDDNLSAGMLRRMISGGSRRTDWMEKI